MSDFSILLLLVVLAVAYRFLKLKKKDSQATKKVAEKEEVFNENPNSATLLRSEEYIERMRRFNNRCYKNLTGQDRINHYGEEGELLVLGHCELVGKSAVYSNVGLAHEGEKCELDILALCKYGLVHVEVKNFSGSYCPADDCTCYRPEKWQKEWKGQTNVLRSPVVQAERSREILADALPSIINESLPIFSVIVFTNGTFKLSRVAEDRIVMCSAETFQEVFDEFVNGRNPEFSEKIDPVGAAKFMAKLKGNDLYPAFYAPETFRCYR
ncbi:nuclease-related domain-containing protein [Maridesulfovibrio salexigens]|uniref:NERD domain protein n=1 Tax=Maridesulfovibrio salexigens (strain ATCC 14822 / DSM 2638 / NCIMB 8403 / VKM B-1763) TaxID=526222 RepID=C6BT10_MARSD|nr:nuclease-related domain-containing protein [Maridesulfovibrio salexigens]ACS79714.1 NERD domain protein [Maridesulfovibrio salexigens DSM 2638]